MLRKEHFSSTYSLRSPLRELARGVHAWSNPSNLHKGSGEQEGESLKARGSTSRDRGVDGIVL